ncbi:MAG: presqualene diphosphate synthase HpnD [Nitrospira sp. SB0677_bin_15]|nr:presqualene diphosphate synthase HpnD [Nitrospira sp. SB0667_bin_9]MYD30750.1 presqualene diphosphate synthase HpnD [Nitrospira sp. SB0661_bin_20]MYG39241.1 presqualene diphosphate synthase HpnD [Nitrospira sp. SB0677_bin_15]MYH01232.1 presqualene diphosphate synthase HpnD [Nitrospira sp. SB0675_bin_23]MYJ23356.1 presqualene diphosphate synthase HpnD [Nitrospira sp. SB0673_bin_12]
MPTISEAHSYCTSKAKDSGSNFYYSFLFLPRPRREAMYTVYTLCHELDADVDHPPHGVDPCDRLAQWRREIKAAYQGVPQYPVTVSLADHARKLGIPQDYFQELIAGMEMDLTIRRYATFDALYPYCYRVASIVGLICLKVFGTVDPRAQDYAVNLGVAFQLTNIIRDVGADAERDRIYVPLEDLATFGCSEERLLSKTASPEFIRLMEFQAARAHDYYRKAQTVYDALSSTDRQSLLAAEIMRDIYFNLLTRIESTRFAVFASRIRVPPFRRVTLALTTWARRSFQNRVSRRT